MDKAQNKALEWMFVLYEPVIQRTIAQMILADIGDITYHFNQSTIGNSEEIRNTLKLDYLFSEHCKRSLVGRLLDVHAPRKHDVVDEIIKQYNLTLMKDEQELYHQKMGDAFDIKIDEARDLLERYAYGVIYSLSKIT